MFISQNYDKFIDVFTIGFHGTQMVNWSGWIGRIEFFNSPDTKMEQVSCQLPSKKSLLIEFYSSVLSTYLNSSAAPGTYWEISHSNWLCHHEESGIFGSIVWCIAVCTLQNVKLIENVFSGLDWRLLQVPTIIIAPLNCFQGIPWSCQWK